MAAIGAAHAQHLAADAKVEPTIANALVPIQGRDHGNLTPPETALQQHLDSHFTVLTLNMRSNKAAISHDLPEFIRIAQPHDALVLTEIGLKLSEHATLRDMLHQLGYTSLHIHSDVRNEGVCIATKTAVPPRVAEYYLYIIQATYRRHK